MTDYIPIDELEVGSIYRLRARNLIIGVWTGYTFGGVREKFYDMFYDACEVPGATAFALEKIGELPEEMKGYLTSDKKEWDVVMQQERSLLVYLAKMEEERGEREIVWCEKCGRPNSPRRMAEAKCCVCEEDFT